LALLTIAGVIYDLLTKAQTMTNQTAQIHINTNRTIAKVSPLLFGGFAEHMGRCIYEGIYDPNSAHADGQGFAPML